MPKRTQTPKHTLTRRLSRPPRAQSLTPSLRLSRPPTPSPKLPLRRPPWRWMPQCNPRPNLQPNPLPKPMAKPWMGAKKGVGFLRRTIAWGFYVTPPPFLLTKILGKSTVFTKPKIPPFWGEGFAQSTSHYYYVAFMTTCEPAKRQGCGSRL